MTEGEKIHIQGGATVVRLKNNTIIHNDTRIKSVLRSYNCNPTLAPPCIFKLFRIQREVRDSCFKKKSPCNNNHGLLVIFPDMGLAL